MRVPPLKSKEAVVFEAQSTKEAVVFEAQPNGVKDSNSEDAVHAKELRENEMSIDALIEALVDHEFYCVSYSTKDN